MMLQYRVVQTHTHTHTKIVFDYLHPNELKKIVDSQQEKQIVNIWFPQMFCTVIWFNDVWRRLTALSKSLNCQFEKVFEFLKIYFFQIKSQQQQCWSFGQCVKISGRVLYGTSSKSRAEMELRRYRRKVTLLVQSELLYNGCMTNSA